LNLLKVTVSLVLVVVILRSVDVTVLWQVIRHANPWYLVGALAASMAGVVLRAYRWQILVNDQGVPASLGELTALWFVSFLFTNILPSGIGGDAVRAYELSRSSERGAQAVTSVLVDRFVGLFALQTIALVALAFSWRLMPDQLVFITVLLFSISLLAAAVLAFPPLWNAAEKWIPFFDRLLSIRFIRSLVDSLQSYTHSALLRAFAVGLVFNILLITITVLVARGLGDTLPLPYYMIFVPIACPYLVCWAGCARGNLRLSFLTGRCKPRNGTLNLAADLCCGYGSPRHGGRGHLHSAQRPRDT
jgi:uncharacterized protein (TIRG00374 family)